MKHMGAVISLSLPWLFTSSSGVGPTWPTADYLWSPVMVDGSLYADAQADAGDYYATKPSKAMDIVGGTDPQGDGPVAAGALTHRFPSCARRLLKQQQHAGTE